ncbi:unnamed protein product [Caenorhabditis brenneri]
MLLLLVFLSVFPTSFAADFLSSDEFFEIKIDRDHPDKVFEDFEAFKKKFHRKYKTPEEEQMRNKVYTANTNTLIRLTKEAEKRGHNTQFGINQFSDFSHAEFQQRLSRFKPNSTLFNSKHKKSLNFKARSKRQTDEQAYPKHYDLRTIKVGGESIVGPVDNQYNCSCCWGFATVAVVETVHAWISKKMRPLSVQELCDCAADEFTLGCSGGYPINGAAYVLGKGLSRSSVYEYDEDRARHPNMCMAGNSTRFVLPGKLDYGIIHPDRVNVYWPGALVDWKSPVAVYFAVGKAFRDYESGVLAIQDCDMNSTEWHAGAIIGYGEEDDLLGNPQKYWIMKNSWGEYEWGDRGYVKIIRGINWCGIEDDGLVMNLADVVTRL